MVLHKVIHKYLMSRRGVYYFRWRIPSDLKELCGKAELFTSLRTADSNIAAIRAIPLFTAVSCIQRAKKSYLSSDLNRHEYLSLIRKNWTIMTSRKKSMGLITFDNIAVDYDGDTAKELAVVKELMAAKNSTDSQSEERYEYSTKLSMSFSELFDKFIEFKTNPKKSKKPIKDDIRKNHERHFRNLKVQIGDVPIQTITRKILKNAILACGNLPKGNLKKYKEIAIEELFEMDIPEEHRIKPKSVEEIQKTAQGIFSYALEEDYVPSSPAISLNLKLSTTCTFASFSDAEVEKLITFSMGEKPEWKTWLPALAAFTGARRGELVQLRNKDIKYDSDSERHYILISEDAGSVKTDNSIRQIPIHAFLIEAGFLEWVNSKAGNLFGDLNPASVTQWFTNFRDKMGIEKFDDFGNRKVFHSFRHSFITKSQSVGNPTNLVQQVVGHEKVKIGITSRYTHREPLKAVLDVVDKVTYF